MSRLAGITKRQVVVTLAILLVVFPFAAYAVPGLVGADASYVVLTGSMRPAIDPGDVVFVSDRPADTIRVGDVITYDRGSDVPTTHRVIEVVRDDTGLAFRTQGDANEDPDTALVSASQVVGVVVLTVPYLGTVVTAIDTQYGFAALVLLPFALLVLDIAYGAVRNRRRGGTESDADEGGDDSTGPAPVAAFPASQAPVSSNEESVTPSGLDAEAGITARDMTASILLAVGLVAYAAWNAYWQFDALGAPRPETMSVLSGGLVVLGFLGYLRFTGGNVPADERDQGPTVVQTTLFGSGSGFETDVRTDGSGDDAGSTGSDAADGSAGSGLGADDADGFTEATVRTPATPDAQGEEVTDAD